MGRPEIRDLLGLVRQRVYQLTEQPDFPAPVAVLSIGKVWDGAEVRAWANERAKRLARHREDSDAVAEAILDEVLATCSHNTAAANQPPEYCEQPTAEDSEYCPAHQYTTGEADNSDEDYWDD